MNSKFYVSFEAARLLNEKGCGIKGDFLTPVYKENGCLYWSNYEDLSDKIPAITKDEAIDWFESKGMCIIVFRRTIDNKVEWSYIIHGHTEIISGFQTRLEAKDAAIIKACKLLENGN